MSSVQSTVTVAAPAHAGTRPEFPAGLVVLGGLAALLGHGGTGVVLSGAALLVVLGPAFHRDPTARLWAQALGTAALLEVLVLSVPRPWGPAADALLLVCLAGAPLLALVGVSPLVRGVLRLRRPTLVDVLCLYAGFLAALGGAGVTVWVGVEPAGAPNPALVGALALLVPLLSEAVLRGLWMRAAGTGAGSVVLAAVVQGAVVGSGYGALPLLGGTAVGLLAGLLRRGTRHWQPGLMLHTGLGLGLLMVSFLGAMGAMGATR